MQEAVMREVEQFLYREARLLDERRFHAWLDLLTEDVRYWMPVRTNRYPKGSKAIAVLDSARYEEEDLAKAGELAIFDETKETLGRRIARLDTGMAWAEDPPSRTRHLIANIEAEGYIPGSIGRVAELHGLYYHEHRRFGLFFEGKVGTELAEFFGRYDEKRDGFWTISLEERVERT